MLCKICKNEEETGDFSTKTARCMSTVTTHHNHGVMAQHYHASLTTKPRKSSDTTAVMTQHDRGDDTTRPRWRFNTTAVEIQHDRSGDSTRPQWRCKI